jgi:hypothetical protein
MSPKAYADAYTLTICCKNLDRKDITTGKSGKVLLLINNRRIIASYNQVFQNL